MWIAFVRQPIVRRAERNGARPVDFHFAGSFAEVFVVGLIVEAEQIGRVEALLRRRRLIELTLDIRIRNHALDALLLEHRAVMRRDRDASVALNREAMRGAAPDGKRRRE